MERISKGIGERSNITGPEIETDSEPDKLYNITIFDRSDPAKLDIITAREGTMVYSPAYK